ncbi:OsmC family protein [Flavobacterium sp. HSC-61S13]|uniref:OsmC family protein n=1 Tax=Flavobacterium sp. HSC-61S13 TaxID=2910963 RepID=UPI00209F51F8|nr:OsmC family protein [Flavobacterium sp. HSC-61S13]MCP1996168.1 osmotically inducible protein OsmC [Flavobacterium sp. HSC-61S13]
MKFTRTANAIWHKDVKTGSGTISTESKVLDQAPYAFKTRFENGNPGTNPEELLGAAHAGCFTMQLSALLSEQGFVPDELATQALVTFEDGSIALIELIVNATVPNISAEVFNATAQKAKEICPLSKALQTVKIELKANLK